ncbi:hypothetical protein PFISCL1PPCAC_26217, partial [Pristionchus fissidentatus]
TSRAPLSAEVDGRDFHFVSEDRMRKDERNGELIELLYLNDDLYGLTIGGVKDVIRQGQHCMLDVVYDRAIRLLKSANINPIVIFVKPSSPDQIIDWSGGQLSEEEAQIEFNKIQRDEKMFGDLITHVISNAHSFEDVLQQILDIVFGRKRNGLKCLEKARGYAVWIESEEQETSKEEITFPCPKCGQTRHPVPLDADDMQHSSWIR